MHYVPSIEISLRCKNTIIWDLLGFPIVLLDFPRNLLGVLIMRFLDSETPMCWSAKYTEGHRDTNEANYIRALAKIQQSIAK